VKQTSRRKGATSVFNPTQTSGPTSTEADTSVTIEGRDIKVGINPGLLKAIEASVPLGRGGTPEEAAGAVYLFCIPESNYISGQSLVVDGGVTNALF